MKKEEVIEILKEVNKGTGIDDMTIAELRESVIAVTGLVMGLLLAGGKTVDEVKEIMR